MPMTFVEDAIESLEKANADLDVELLDREKARALLESYARAEKLAAYGVAALARRIDDRSEVARTAGVSAGKAKAVVQTGKVLATSNDLSAAMQHGDISLDQAREIASAEESAPGVAAQLVAVAETAAFHVLRDRARKARLEAEQHRDLACRQRDARGPAATATT
jgi:hypothetical protein